MEAEYKNKLKKMDLLISIEKAKQEELKNEIILQNLLLKNNSFKNNSSSNYFLYICKN